MRSFGLALPLSLLVLLPGCATITGDTVQSIKVETRLADGTEVKDADCEISNEHGLFRVRTPGNITVRRSPSDMHVICKKDQQPDARATATSRVNAGMFGNIIFGGGIGAIIDHSKGTAYTYPQWLQMVFGKVLAFDRTDDKDGQPSLAREIESTGPQKAGQKSEEKQASATNQ